MVLKGTWQWDRFFDFLLCKSVWQMSLLDFSFEFAEIFVIINRLSTINHTGSQVIRRVSNSPEAILGTPILWKRMRINRADFLQTPKNVFFSSNIWAKRSKEVTTKFSNKVRNGKPIREQNMLRKNLRALFLLRYLQCHTSTVFHQSSYSIYKHSMSASSTKLKFQLYSILNSKM